VSARRPPSRTSDHVALPRALAAARRQGLFARLTEVYGEFPETRCDNCARCCFESPGIFFVEYLFLLEALTGLPRPRREELLRRGVEELFFSWIEPARQCMFLEDGQCAIYARRPLACRLFGLVAPEERDRVEAEARLAARQEASRLRLLGIEAPAAVVERSLASCDRVRDLAGRPVRVDADALAARVAHLDQRLLAPTVVLNEFCFRSLPERLGAAALGADAVDPMRLQLLRRAQRGEPRPDLLDLVWARLRLPLPLRMAKGDP